VKVHFRSSERADITNLSKTKKYGKGALGGEREELLKKGKPQGRRAEGNASQRFWKGRGVFTMKEDCEDKGKKESKKNKIKINRHYKGSCGKSF